MLIAYHMSVHDDGTHMLGPDTYCAPVDAGYYDWRFGRDGVPHPATCPTCGRKTDPHYINPHFRVRCRKRDLTATYDGYVLASTAFRTFCESSNTTAKVQFIPLPSDDEYFVFKPNRILAFDTERRKTRFEDFCPTCNKYFNVVGATPAYLRDVTTPLTEGFFRSDLEFASGHEQSPLIFVGIDTATVMMQHRFQKVDLKPIHS